ncbi:Transcriptional regulator, contains XRE-family HTH domain [Lutimaribacter pacificus]|uniref:Transcriptional regulator, contains XRE-family HTH domain n=1 Tax=Lutimaribacter pacificus TaxID=391948 RepID=A0A1H0BMF5_9RHOB|nr:helix-turn-helix transcriptional regulator [Lutimaribacter pacificus]SDN46829.1 Transcriptional regulator, contains XRE-family HTH domain [Lutimaribacter pacificus]SHJ54444.1 Transcriptional regulator, contains XRE-family HTH domain [Lutimaribacter pacificus]
MEQTDTNDWYGPDAATFGDRLAAAREAAGMTQKQMARRLGVKLGTLTAWENDMSEPRANRLQMMAGILNVSIMWLLTGEGDGLAAPEDETTIPPEVNDLLVEIRDLKAQITASAERLGRLEKQLRLTLKSGT